MFCKGRGRERKREGSKDAAGKGIAEGPSRVNVLRFVFRPAPCFLRPSRRGAGQDPLSGFERERPGQKRSQRPTRGETGSSSSAVSAPALAYAYPMMDCVRAARGADSIRGTPLLRTSAMMR